MDRDSLLIDRALDRRRTSLTDALAGTPERRLMLAVLMDAVHRCRRRRSDAREGGLGWRADDAWLRSEDRSWPFSFACICDQLGIDSTYLRRSLAGREPAATRGARPGPAR